jgi:hypothetical protein
MFKQIQDASPSFRGRIAGVFYFFSVITAICAEVFVRGRLLYAAGLVPVLCFAAATLLLYSIFRPVNQTIALLAVSSNLIGLAFEALERHLWGVDVAMVLHGAYCLLIGYLVIESTFLPRILGALMGIAGLAWLSAQLPGLTHLVYAVTQALGFLGEGSLMLWLLVMGINLQRGHEGKS